MNKTESYGQSLSEYSFSGQGLAMAAAIAGGIGITTAIVAASNEDTAAAITLGILGGVSIAAAFGITSVNKKLLTDRGNEDFATIWNKGVETGCIVAYAAAKHQYGVE